MYKKTTYESLRLKNRQTYNRTYMNNYEVQYSRE